MTKNERINAFTLLGDYILNLTDLEFKSIALQAKSQNPWFTEENVRLALDGIASFLQAKKLNTWLDKYTLPPESKKVALVMAGNIPLVGFHDVLCILLSGHKALIKLSSKDTFLPQHLLGKLIQIESRFSSSISYAEQLKDFDAVIATGSDNSSRYFEYYFGKYPNIIRKNRTSVAILDGTETNDDLKVLGKDVFSYFGLGCRNVAKLFVPSGYSFNKLFESWEFFHDIIHHHKYCNNYDYQKSIMLVNKIPFLDNGFVMIHENDKLISPISVLYYTTYQNVEELNSLVQVSSDKLQCVLGKHKPATVAFGNAQLPELWDYADQVDTLDFLCTL